MPSAQLVQEIAQRRGSDGIRCNSCGQGSCPVYLPSSIVSIRSHPLWGPNPTLTLSTSKMEVKAILYMNQYHELRVVGPTHVLAVYTEVYEWTVN